ncbi:SHOCT domain-containing protein [Occultella glacieicola]|uniref:SHOCT domain-containing protein n=1 Tax=Occultella glacieicola TaxID=2518684 RepID=A0ABY2E1X1_9MICO|nr:SHOCT domain-containing protein [Occultella glacieicola]TDE92594.1 SHOCT domain-containing protein [Occultella glacieicola]
MDLTLGEVFWSMLWFFLFFIWVWLLISVFADIFRSDDMGGWAKALWTLLVIVLPYLGVFVYLIARGKKLGQHAARDAQLRDQQMRDYVQSFASPSGSTASEIEKLAGLHQTGALTEDEFVQAKAKLLA